MIRILKSSITVDILKIKREYTEELWAKKFINLNEISGFLEKDKLLKLTQEEKESLNKPVTIKEIDMVIKHLHAHIRADFRGMGYDWGSGWGPALRRALNCATTLKFFVSLS